MRGRGFALVTLHDIGEGKAAFPKLLFYVRRWVEGVKSKCVTECESVRFFVCGPLTAYRQAGLSFTRSL